MTPHVRQKWRPRLGLVLLMVLLAVLALPAGIVLAFRALDHSASPLGAVESLGMLAALLVTLVIAYVLSRTLTGPIEALVRLSEAIRQGGRAAIVAPEQQGTAEIARLTDSLLDLAAQLVDRNDYLVSFTAHVTHELKSPLASIQGAAELLREDLPPADRMRFADNIAADTRRLAELLDRLRALAAAGGEQPLGSIRPADLSPLLAGRQPHMAIRVTAPEACQLPLAPSVAAIIFGHLLDNAAEQGAGLLAIHVEPRGATLRLLVSDDGPGIGAGNRDRVFEPFFTTRRETGGTGLGLAIVAALIAGHRGAIRLLPPESSAVLGGAAFEIVLPADQPR